MKTSENTDQIAKAMSIAQGKIKNPEKNRTATIVMKSGQKYSFNYADLPATFEAVQPAFAENGLSHTTAIKTDPNGTMLVARISHVSGQYYESEIMLPNSPDIKALAANITYLTRYLFTALAGIAADEDLDGEPEGQGTYQDRKPNSSGGAPGPVVKPVPALTQADWAKLSEILKENQIPMSAAASWVKDHFKKEISKINRKEFDAICAEAVRAGSTRAAPIMEQSMPQGEFENWEN